MGKDWIPIFKTGIHTDSQGRTKTWTEWDIDNIINKFNPAVGVPVVIGHPKNDAPAYGWVEALRRAGQVLYYKPGQVVEEFRDMVSKGLYKKRSISLYPDNTLRHIGYLGAAPPSIKGLPDHTFSSGGDVIDIEFSMKDDWERAVKEEEILERMATLIAGEMQANKAVNFKTALKKVVDENADIAEMLKEAETKKMKRQIKKIGAGEILGLLVDGRRENDSALSYSQAFNEVQVDYPEIAWEYAEEIGT